MTEFLDSNSSEEAGCATVAAMATNIPEEAKIMKCGAISNRESLSMGIIIPECASEAGFSWVESPSRNLPHTRHCL